MTSGSGEPKNPFDRYDIDPAAPPAAITERFRELVADAPEGERDALRAAWDALTLHPENRVRAAFFSHPETRAPIGDPPRRKRERRAETPSVTLAGLLVLPSLVALVPRAPTTPPDFPIDLSDPALTEK